MSEGLFVNDDSEEEVVAPTPSSGSKLKFKPKGKGRVKKEDKNVEDEMDVDEMEVDEEEVEVKEEKQKNTRGGRRGAQKGKEIDVDANNLDEDANDPVVNEFPVFFSTRLAGNIHLYQYPARSIDAPYTSSHHTGISESRLKKESGVVEVDVPVPTDRCYDNAKGGQWKNIRSQTLKGHLVASNPQENMVGVFKNNELHLNPIVSTALLRPAFDHVNNENIKDPAAAAAAAARRNNNANEPKAIQMTVKSSSEQTPRFSGALLAVKKAEDEQFVTLEWRDRDQEDTWDVGELLVADKKEKLDCVTSREEYLEAISVPYVDPVTMAARCL